MDPKQLAEEIIESLFSEQPDREEEIHEDMPYSEEEEDELYEEAEADEDEEEDEEEDEDEDYGDEDEGEDEPSAQTPQAAPQQGNAGATLQMKPSMAKSSLPMGGVPSGSNDLEHDAHGGSAQDAHGKGFVLGTKETVGDAAANAATLQMKPSFVSPSMNMESLVKDVKTMFGGSEDLSEEFISKAASLYEAAIVTKVSSIANSLRSELAEQFEQKILDVKFTLEEQLDTYLNYVVEEWMKENEIAVENGLRTEIAENFIRGLKNLFTESYIEVPEDKTNVFDELSETVSHLENRLNEEIESNAKLVRQIKNLKASQVFMEQTSNLTSYQVEQLRPLVENLSFESEKDFSEKISVLVEGVVNTSKKQTKPQTRSLMEKVILDEETEQEEQQELNPSMALYSKVLERSLQN